MGTIDLIADYFGWHYSEALKDLLQIEKNFIRFVYHLFSIPLLWRTLFSPVYHLSEKRAQGFDVQGMLERLVINTVMRLVGFFARMTFLIAGVFAELILIIIAIPILFVWLILPLIVAALFISGLSLIF